MPVRTDSCPIRVFLVDDHPLVREGLRSVLSQPDVELIAEAPSASEALRLLESNTADVVLMDISLPGMSGLDATREVRQRYPNTAVIILTVYDSEAYYLEAILAGASGYILKDSPQSAILLAIHAAYDGYVMAPRELVRKASTTTSPRSISGRNQLTTRELEVLRLIATGMTNKLISNELNLAEITGIPAYMS